MADTKSILIVEDERPLALALKLKLEKAGFAVQVATDGKHATEILEKEDFDLMLLDLIMPRLDGFGVLQWLQDKKKRVKVIVTSNLGQEEDIARVKKLGAVDYYVKADTSLATIVEKVTALLGGG
jgi:DNA-binding response OmpR family regulator